MNSASPNKIAQLFQQAREHENLDYWPAAIDTYSQIIAMDPTCVAAYVERGLLVREMGDPERAMLDFERALQIDPEYGLAYYGRGWVKHFKGDYQGELQDAIRGLKLDPANVSRYYLRIATAFTGLKEFDKAVKAYDEAVRLTSGLVEGIIYNRGLCYRAMGEYELALADFNRSLELDPGWDWALMARGHVYLKLAAYERAIADFSEVIQDKPNDFTAHKYRGIAYLKMGNKPRAKDDFKKAMQLAESPSQSQLAEGLFKYAKRSPLLQGLIDWVREPR